MITHPPGVDPADEVLEKRTPKAKIYAVPGRDKEFNIRVHTASIQYKHPDETVLREIDLAWQDNGDGTFGLTDTEYLVKSYLPADGLGWWFRGLRGGTTVDVKLLDIDTGAGWVSAPATIPMPTVVGSFLEWKAVTPGIDIQLMPRPHGLGDQKIVSGYASAAFRWEIIKDSGSRERVQSQGPRGHDNINDIATRVGDRDRRRTLEVSAVVEPGGRRGARTRQVVTETWTGRVARVDKVTRTKSWTTDRQDPVRWIS